jgi:hypothetical protein
MRPCNRPDTAAVWHQPNPHKKPQVIIVTTAAQAKECLKYLNKHIPPEGFRTYGITKETE